MDEYGNPVDRDEVKVTVFKRRWRWWFDVSYDSYGSYNSNSYQEIIKETTVNTRDGKATVNIQINYPDWGRYYVLVEEPGGHRAGKTIYFDWPEWVGRSKRQMPGDASVLAFTADKDKYNVGEMATLTFPSSGFGRALLTIESGTSILEARWIEPREGETETQVAFKVTEDMTPNVYAHITLIQPHGQTANDHPIRLYGISPILVEDPNTHLVPEINMPQEIRPEESFTVKVSEKQHKKMTYTLAVVDEGLLDLTNFKTPDPWNNFFAKEALGVKTWDIYDLVLGAYGGKMEKLFAIGGGDEEEDQGDKKANRFKPVVQFLGPFEYNGGINSHIIQMPKYVGSVRTMVIAGDLNAYGFAETTTAVRNPVMVLATLPRVLAPTEKVQLPVTVFAMDENIRNVDVWIEANTMFTIIGKNKQTIRFDETGDQVIDFALSVAEMEGLGKITVFAKSGTEKASYDIEIDIRSPNNTVYDTFEKMISAASGWEKEFVMPGVKNTNSAVLQVSTIPPIDLDYMIRYLLQYPHGCTEQITSTVFWQLYLDEFSDLSDDFIGRTEFYIKDGITQLMDRQKTSGGFLLWPGSYKPNDWVSSYAGHFLLEAEKKGYFVSETMKSKWIKYQKKAAREWRRQSSTYEGYYYGTTLTQAYRLFTLALANDPDMGSMNRFREKDHLNTTSKWLLAASYHLAGKEKIAAEIAGKLTTTAFEKEADYYNSTYGSGLRDDALILISMVVLDKQHEAEGLALNIVNEMNEYRWMSTQTTAFCLYALSAFAKGQDMSGSELIFTYQLNNDKETQVNLNKNMIQIPLNFNENEANHLQLKNNSETMLYAKLSLSGKPAIGQDQYRENRIRLNARYFDLNGHPISIDSLEQGTDFIASVSVELLPGNKDVYDVALSQLIPSGWEIINTRLADYDSDNSDYSTYTDIRDDKVYQYFNLYKNKKRTYEIRLNAAYKGTFYLPAVSCEAMYDHSYFGQLKGKWVKVIEQD